MIYFLTVNYHSKSLIETLICSIQNSIKTDYQFIIVNNSPEEADIHSLKSGSTLIIESGANLGFGAACNLGINHVYAIDKSAVIWLINPDTSLDSHADEYIQSCLHADSDIAILGTQIRDSNGEMWFGSGHFNKWNGHLYHVKNLPQTDYKTIPCQWVSGCSLIINLSKFDYCPAFDPSFFLYGEDADFCERYRHMGYPVAVTSKVLVTHQVSAIIGKNERFMYEHYTFGRLLFLKKHATPVGLLLYIGYLLSRLVVSLPLGSPNALGRWQGFQRFMKTQVKA